MSSHASYCCVEGCGANIRENITFFRCPRDAKRCQQWKDALGFGGQHKYAKLTSLEAYSRIRVCRSHFDEKSFTTSGKRLLNTAVPTKLLPKFNDNKQASGNKHNIPGPSSELPHFKSEIQADSRQELDKALTNVTSTSDKATDGVPLRSDKSVQCEFMTARTNSILTCDKSVQCGIHDDYFSTDDKQDNNSPGPSSGLPHIKSEIQADSSDELENALTHIKSDVTSADGGADDVPLEYNEFVETDFNQQFVTFVTDTALDSSREVKKEESED